jgi:hypothetical protein
MIKQIFSKLEKVVAASMLGISLLSTTFSKEAKAEDNYQYNIQLDYESGVVQKLDNIPEKIRNVPIHSEDSYAAGNQGPISHDSAFPGGTVLLEFGISKRLIGYENNFKVGALLGLDFGGMLRGADHERNYTNSVGSEKRGDGAALTYYSILPAYLDKWNSAIRPAILGELELGSNPNRSLVLRYLLYEERLMAETGWDRFNSQDANQRFELARYLVNQLQIGLRFKHDDSREFYLGISKPTNIKYTELGNQTDITFKSGLSIGGQFTTKF